MNEFSLRLSHGAYPIVIGRHIARRLPATLSAFKDCDAAWIVTTPVVKRLHGLALQRLLTAKGIVTRLITVPDGETSKSFAMYMRLIDALAREATRHPVLLALGGGVVGDLTGFVAATYKRGIPYVQLPTTLLAQVDSSIGGKTAIDLPVGKNLVGAFYQPRAVLSDIAYLQTLPKPQLCSGLAEVIKYGMLGDAMLFQYLESRADSILRANSASLEWIVMRCAQAKVRFVERDECDRLGIRMHLNFGHTIGHAIEAAGSYRTRYDHGQAVAVGMIGETRLAVRLGLCRPATLQRLVQLIERLGLPTACVGIQPQKILQAMRHDKKFTAAGTRFVLPTRIGRTIIHHDAPWPLIKEVVDQTASTSRAQSRTHRGT